MALSVSIKVLQLNGTIIIKKWYGAKKEKRTVKWEDVVEHRMKKNPGVVDKSFMKVVLFSFTREDDPDRSGFRIFYRNKDGIWRLTKRLTTIYANKKEFAIHSGLWVRFKWENTLEECDEEALVNCMKEDGLFGFVRHKILEYNDLEPMAKMLNENQKLL